jgi:P2 family phage major capsid protein
MKNTTRPLFNQLLSTVAQMNGVANATEQFVVEPSVQQTLETKMTEQVGFLNEINVYVVDELKGEKLGMSITRTIAGRTSTANLPRKPQYVGGLDQRGFELHDTEFDTAIKWNTLDQWAKFPNFGALYSNAVAKAIGQDRIRAGWHGTSVAAQTNRVANPNLEDLNEGWLQELRTQRPGHVLGTAGNHITIGVGGDYESLDGLAYDMVAQLPDWARGAPDLVAIVSHDLLDEKYFPLFNQTGGAIEQLARDELMKSSKQLGGHQAVRVPYFPSSKLFITPLKNLSIYTQDGARRRYIRDEPDFKQVADYQSSNEDYIIEDLDFAILAEFIDFV